MTSTATAHRAVIEIRDARPARDGDGVAIRRVSGMRHAGMDPILMLDELSSDQREDFAGGFPPHPHRGMQTLTYMRSGGLVHEDNQGNRGEIRAGGAQWMSAGRGIIHSEMPTADTSGMHGFQLWINLPAARKMSAPDYRDLAASELAHLSGPGFTLAAMAGDWQVGADAVRGPLQELAQLAGVADLNLEGDHGVDIPVDAGDNALVYVYEGNLRVAAAEAVAGQLLVTGPGDLLRLEAAAGGARALLLKGTPLREPVANYGPFVMNTPEEIDAAVAEYQRGEFA